MSKNANRIRISFILIIALSFCLIQLSGIISSAITDDHGIITTVTTDKQSYLPGEEVLINITLTNTNTTDVELWSGCWPVHSYQILDERGSTVYWQPQVVLWVICNETLSPGESIYFMGNWKIPTNQSSGNYTIRARAYDVEPDSCQFAIIGTSPPEDEVTPRSILTNVESNKIMYDQNEDIEITITIFNPTNSSIDLYSGGSPPWYIRITNESGGLVYNRGGEAAMIVTDSIGPNESKIFPHTVTKNFTSGFYRVEGGAFDVPSVKIWIKINETAVQDIPQNDSVVIVAIFIFGIGIGFAALFLIRNARKKQ